MKKTLLLTLLLAFAFLTCDDDKTKKPITPPPPTLDERLIGGRWYFPASYSNTTSLTPKTSDGYYKFTEDSKLIYSNETTYYKNIANNLSESVVYSANGIVYISDPYRNVMKYDFHNEFPYPNSTYYLSGDQRLVLNRLASKGDLITYRIFFHLESIYSDSRYDAEWFLVRFKDDGTPYRNYY